MAYWCYCDGFCTRRDNFITGETNFQQDMNSIKGKAEQQGSAQPELRNVAKDIKKVRGMPAPCHTNGKHIHLMFLCRPRGPRGRPCYTHMLKSAEEMCRTWRTNTQRQRQIVHHEAQWCALCIQPTISVVLGRARCWEDGHALGNTPV